VINNFQALCLPGRTAAQKALERLNSRKMGKNGLSRLIIYETVLGGFFMIRQIILITDGCSNVGIEPAVAASHAFAENIVVNVIGVIDRGEIGQRGAMEIEEIARAGGGMSRIVLPSQLSQTVQMMTRKTVAQTIQQVVHKELESIVGHSSIQELPPEEREQVVQVMEDLSEKTSLRVALLIDASASMKPKMAEVEEAVRDLQLSLQAREGDSEISVFHFPGNKDKEIEMDAGWTRELDKLPSLFYKLNMKGTTPTGPAILHVVRYFVTGRFAEENTLSLSAELADSSRGGKAGLLGDYIV
jgi:Ca-activated chloride channel family protein